MASYLDAFEGGGVFSVTYGLHSRQGDLANILSARNFDVIVVDATERRSRFGQADLDALRGHYASGKKALMLDGTLNIRFVTHDHLTEFPGASGSSAGLLVNQVASIAHAGGGILIGTDHDAFQTSANAAISALVPGARFRGLTNPSTDGAFIGKTLLAERVTVRANDVLEHWQTIPNQGEAPTGAFTDFLGGPVTFYALVEAADKPGGGTKRPYISASFDPGQKRTAIDSDLVTFDEPLVEETPPLPENMPTRVGGPK